MITENVPMLKIHRLTQAQYDRELECGNLDEDAWYLTPSELLDIEHGGTGATTVEDALSNLSIGLLSNLKTNAKTSIVDAINELYDMLSSITNK